MISEPHRIEPDRLGCLRHGDQLGKWNFPFDFGELDTDLHDVDSTRAAIGWTSIESIPTSSASAIQVAVTSSSKRGVSVIVRS